VCPGDALASICAAVESMSSALSVRPWALALGLGTRHNHRHTRIDRVGHSAAAFSNPRRRWCTVDGEHDQQRGVCAGTAGGAANGHIRSHSGRARLAIYSG
jgi:hypothetical protein